MFILELPIWPVTTQGTQGNTTSSQDIPSTVTFINPTVYDQFLYAQPYNGFNYLQYGSACNYNGYGYTPYFYSPANIIQNFLCNVNRTVSNFSSLPYYYFGGGGFNPYNLHSGNYYSSYYPCRSNIPLSDFLPHPIVGPQSIQHGPLSDYLPYPYVGPQQIQHGPLSDYLPYPYVGPQQITYNPESDQIWNQLGIEQHMMPRPVSTVTYSDQVFNQLENYLRCNGAYYLPRNYETVTDYCASQHLSNLRQPQMSPMDYARSLGLL